jgi:hypothetical protein
VRLFENKMLREVFGRKREGGRNPNRIMDKII